MKYMLLIHQGTAPTPRSPEEWARLERGRAERGLRRLPGDQPDRGRHPRPRAGAVPRRRRRSASDDGKPIVTDGPFAESKEALGGWLLFEADDLDAAVELAARVPAARMGGAVEVRPIAER